MRRLQGGAFAHWCPACESMHPLPASWRFDGNLDRPTFQPSFRQLLQHEKGGDCHYNITNGEIVWHGDCWHRRTGQQPMVRLDTVDYADDPLMWGELKVYAIGERE